MPYLSYQRAESVASETRRGEYSCFERLLSGLPFRRRTSTHSKTNVVPRSRIDDTDWSPDIEKSEIEISGSRGNVKLGASLKTNVYSQQQTLIKCQHFLELDGGASLAKQMKMKNGDELLILTDTFVPLLNHAEVLNLFLNIKVNGQSTNKLVVRRKKWYELSFILSPGSKPDKDVNIFERKSKKVRTFETELTETVHVYRIPGKQHYLCIDDNGLGITPLSRDEGNSTKLIQKKTVVRQHTDGQIVFYVALKDKVMSRYISVNTENEKIILSMQPQWFQYGTSGGRAHFVIEGFYLGYDHGEEKVKPQKSEFWFEEFKPDHLN